MHGLVRCTHWVQVFTCAGWMWQSDVTIKTPDRKCTRGREWCHAQKHWGFWNLKKKNSELRFGLGWRKSIFGACWGQTSNLREEPHVVGADGKVSIERNCLSLLMSKNLKLKKVNKRISWSYIFLHMCIWNIHISGYVTLVDLLHTTHNET